MVRSGGAPRYRTSRVWCAWLWVMPMPGCGGHPACARSAARRDPGLGASRVALTGAVPHEPSWLVAPPGFTRLGAVLDLSLLVPAYLLAAVGLWRRRAWGYLLATVVLVAGSCTSSATSQRWSSQIRADILGCGIRSVGPSNVALFATGGGPLLANLRPATPERSSPRRAPLSRQE